MEGNGISVEEGGKQWAIQALKVGEQLSFVLMIALAET